MKKANDGYVLIYVIFVILLLCIISAGICTAALNGLHTRTAQAQHLQDRYAAAGEIERFMADVCADINRISGSDLTDEEVFSDLDSKLAAVIAVYDLLPGESANSFTRVYRAENGSVSVSAELEFTICAEYSEADATDGQINPRGNLSNQPIADDSLLLYDYKLSAVSSYTYFQIGGLP